MSAVETFLDTSVLLYLLSADEEKANRAEELLAARAMISVQVLNEFAAVALRKLKLSVVEVREILSTIRAVCEVESITLPAHDRGLDIKERYGFSFYDSVLVATALIAGVKLLYSEDLQDGQVIDQTLRVVNPFAKRR